MRLTRVCAAPLTHAAVQLYGSLRKADWFRVRQALCRFFQDRRVKVSLFLQDGIQNIDGTIVLDMRGRLPDSTDRVGRIDYYSGGSKVSSQVLEACQVEGQEKASKGFKTPLGSNMYLKDRKKEPKKPKKEPEPGRHARGGTGAGASRGGASALMAEGKAPDDETSASEATAGLNLLANLLGTAAGGDGDEAGSGGGGSSSVGGIKFNNLFAEDPFGSGGGTGTEARSQMIMIDAGDRESMAEMMSKLGMDDDGGE